MPIPWVVKLGGSFGMAETLPYWLEALAGCRVVVAPGGGLFADTVRTAQRRWGFADRLAHRLAIIAMRQYGLMLHGLCPRLETADAIDALAAGLPQGAAVWLPGEEILEDTRIEASWRVTSDSLAAWLADRIGAERLLLIKSATPPPGACGVAELSGTGLGQRLSGHYAGLVPADLAGWTRTSRASAGRLDRTRAVLYASLAGGRVTLKLC